MARVLVVDDDSDQLTLRQRVLEVSGHQVAGATGVGEALSQIAAFGPQVLIMDLRLPAVKDGLALIRQARQMPCPPKIVVLSGWPADLCSLPEEKLVARVLCKPAYSETLLRVIRELVIGVALLLITVSAGLAKTFHFTLERPAEVVAELALASPGSDWARPGSEAALAALTVDDHFSQHVMLYAGVARHLYAAFLGQLAAGEHRLEIARDSKYSAQGSGLEIGEARFRSVAPEDPYWPVLAHAPILFARADSVGSFTDIPLLSYCERLSENGQPVLQYTMIFSNEDGGTSTRALMARWGRATDIEYIYRAWLDPHGALARATIQANGHREVEFQGRREGTHPLLIPSTRNNMVAAEGSSPIRYQIPPLEANLSAHSREQIMDEHPFTYRVMAQELEREGKLRSFGRVDGEKISDPRNYLYLEAKVKNDHAAVAALVRLRGASTWRSSHLGRGDYAIARDGWFRTTIELPPGTGPDQIAELGFECLVAPVKPEPAAGVCRLEAVSKIFFLDADDRPGPSIWSLTQPVEIPSGITWVSALASEPSRSPRKAAW